MKRIFILVVVTLLAVGSTFADEKVLIDFSQLIADITVGQDADAPNRNRATLMDLNNETIGNFTARQKQELKSSLSIAEWDVVLAPSSRNVTTRHLSHTREVASKEFGTVMGVRINFPTEPFNSWARIQPPFAVPAFQPATEISDDGTIAEPEPGTNGITQISRFEGAAGDDGKPVGGLGLIKNVGTIKSIAVNVYGLNFPHTLSVILIDDKGVEKTYFMGNLNFDGWGELKWNNPAYVQNVRNRDLRTDPIYPDSTPYIKFGGFLVQRQANMKGGDFITYFKDVKVIYDQAVLEVERDIDDEGAWNIIETRDTNRRNVDMERLGQLELQRATDLNRQAEPNSTFTRSPGASDQE